MSDLRSTLTFLAIVAVLPSGRAYCATSSINISVIQSNAQAVYSSSSTNAVYLLRRAPTLQTLPDSEDVLAFGAISNVLEGSITMPAANQGFFLFEVDETLRLADLDADLAHPEEDVPPVEEEFTFDFLEAPDLLATNETFFFQARIVPYQDGTPTVPGFVTLSVFDPRSGDTGGYSGQSRYVRDEWRSGRGHLRDRWRGRYHSV
jgi:hypothetical protein